MLVVETGLKHIHSKTPIIVKIPQIFLKLLFCLNTQACLPSLYQVILHACDRKYQDQQTKTSAVTIKNFFAKINSLLNKLCTIIVGYKP